MTAINFFGFDFKNLKETSDRSFLILVVCIKITSSFFFKNFFSEIITLAPFFIAFSIKLFPSNLFPFIAKKI